MCSCFGGPCDEAVCRTQKKETLRQAGRVDLDHTDLSCRWGCGPPSRCWLVIARRCQTHPKILLLVFGQSYEFLQAK